MKKRFYLLTLMACLSLTPAPAAEETPLGKQMEATNDSFKAFRRETDPVKGATHAREAQVSVLKAAGEIPDLLKKMPDGPEKAKALVTYRKMMGKLYITLCEVEEAFLNGKIEDVAKLVDSLKEQKRVGHDKFMEEGDE